MQFTIERFFFICYDLLWRNKNLLINWLIKTGFILKWGNNSEEDGCRSWKHLRRPWWKTVFPRNGDYYSCQCSFGKFINVDHYYRKCSFGKFINVDHYYRKCSIGKFINVNHFYRKCCIGKFINVDQFYR